MYGLKLDWAYGYRGHQCRNNLHYNNNGQLVYFVAGVCIVHDTKEKEQKFYQQHTDDVLCLTLDRSKALAASGQIGKDPFVCVWDTNSLKTASILREFGHSAGVSVVAFSPDSQLFLSVGLDNDSTLIIWDWRRAKILARSNEKNNKVFDAQFHPTWSNTIVTCGLKHVCFWQLCGNVLTPTFGDFGPHIEAQTSLCIAFGNDAITFTGGLNGNVCLWQKIELVGEIEVAHQGGVFCICHTEDGYLTGGRDGKVKVWDSKFKNVSTINMSKSKGGYSGKIRLVLTLTDAGLHKQIDDLWIRAIDFMEDKVIVGTHKSEIFEISLRDRDNPICVVNGHSEGELWALATHPKKHLFATGADDQTVRLWNSTEHRLLQLATLEHWLRSADFNFDGSLLACGLANGGVTVLKVKDFTEVTQFRNRKRPIHELKFGGELLAVGCNDGAVDIYHVTQRFKLIGSCQASASNVTHLDWSTDHKHIQINTGSGERFIFRIPSCKLTTSAEENKSITWLTWTCTIGSNVRAIWPKYARTDDINAVDVNFEKSLIATSDDFGFVKLFSNYPLTDYSIATKSVQKLRGHSSHVTNVRWMADKETLVSTGGADHAIFQWHLTKQDETESIQIAKVAAPEVESEEDGDDGDLDSDIEHEKLGKGYERAISKDKAKGAMRKLIRKELKTEGKKRTGPPNAGLKLEHVFGYRGYDCRNNIFFTQSGEIIYHVAAVGIVQNRETAKQRFYIGHTDDILCLCLHPQKDIVATAQVGKDPTIHIWDAQTMQPISILKGGHTHGICALDFSGDGKKLASIGLDNYHSLVDWDWKKGEKVGETRGHQDKIFAVKFDPTDDTKLVTVGVKHIKFWTQTGGGFVSTRGVFGSVAKQDTMLSVEFGKEAHVCYSGAASGLVYCWNEGKLTRTIQAANGPLFAIFALDMGFVTGSKDGQVSLWDEKFEKALKKYPVAQEYIEGDSVLVCDKPVIRAVALGHGKVVAGTKSGEIVEIDKGGPVKILTQGHCQGELWGLASHPKANECCTVSDDHFVRCWNVEKGKLICAKKLSAAARSVSYSTDGNLVAIGLKDGGVLVLKTADFAKVQEFRHRNEEISDVKFSPDGKYLAVGSHDNFIDIYEMSSGKRVGICKGSSSYVTHIDWDKSGSMLQLNSGAREQLYFEAPQGNRQPLKPEVAETDIDWHSQTGVLGPSYVGIWPPSSDVTDVNAACLHNKEKLLATGDDFGFVKLFDFPAKMKYAKSKSYLGHSAHVTNVRWSADGTKLFSVGGADTALFVWALNVGGAGGQSDTSDTDSDEEGDVQELIKEMRGTKTK